MTYVLAGRMRHQDIRGNQGLLQPGSVQWMTAASGLIHSEMPEQAEGLMRGFQLWVNLPAADKMGLPTYQDIAPTALPVVEMTGASVKVLAGSFANATSPVRTGATRPTYLDIVIQAAATLSVPTAPLDTAFVYVYEGQVSVGGSPVAARTIAVLYPGDSVKLTGDQDSRMLLVAGRPLNEPVAKHGPFVMNTAAEIRDAFADCHAGRMG